MLVNTLKYVVVVAIIVSMTSCSTSSKRIEKQYYMLETSSPHMVDSSGKKIVGVSLLKLPSYLDQGALVMKREGNTLDVASYHLWANDLADSIKNVLLVDLNKTETHYFYVNRCSDCAQLIFDINHFYATESGDVVLSGYYSIENSDVNAIEKAFYFKRALDVDGFDESVNKLRDLISDLSADIHSSMEK